MPARPLEYRMIDGQIVSGHTSRNGVFVDKRPVTFTVYSRPAHKNAKVPTKVLDGRTKKFVGHIIHGQIIDESTIEIVFHGHKITVPYDSSQVPTEESYNLTWAPRIAAQEAIKTQRKTFDAGYSTIDQIASKWLSEAPKQARRFSSGVESISDSLLMEKIFGPEFATQLAPHEIVWCKIKMKKALNNILNG